MQMLREPICEKLCSDVNHEAFSPEVPVDVEKVKLVMISEALPKELSDYFYAGQNASFFKTTQTAFEDAGFKFKSTAELSDTGIYLTTALKCSKQDYLVTTDTIKHCSYSLEQELDLFKNVKVIMCMGDVAIKSINYIYKRKFGEKVIPSGSTYKIRNQEHLCRGIRFYPSYTQTGDSFNIEKSKRAMIAEDIKNAMQFASVFQ